MLLNVPWCRWLVNSAPLNVWAGWQNAVHFLLNVSQHGWTQPGTQRLMGFLMINIFVVCWTQPGCTCDTCQGCTEHRRKSQLVAQVVVLVVQEEVVSTLLLFGVLGQREGKVQCLFKLVLLVKFDSNNHSLSCLCSLKPEVNICVLRLK